MWVEVVERPADLVKHVAAWADLAADALEPNVFYEPWMLMPAVEHIGAGHRLLHVLIYKSDPSQPRGPARLCGFFPLERLRRYKGIPISVLRLWDYGECFLCTPLVRKHEGHECLATLLEWLVRDRAASLIDFQKVAGEGPFGQLLVDAFRARGTLHFVSEAFTRAWFRPRADAETYLQAVLSSNKRRDLQRKQRRLTELGALELLTFEKEAEVRGVIDDFMRVEASGWKGKAGTALDSRAPNRACFRQLAQEGAKRGQIFVHGLYLNREPIALRWNFVSRPGSFFFKPAYDERYAPFSPGVLLELETIRYLHRRREIEWMDSCTSPANDLLNKLWLDRKIIQSVVAAPGSAAGRVLVSLLPPLRWVNRTLGRYHLEDT
jgi:CelD/BcsL family acetyltransferase involved in cellulose biosynthesis